MKYHLVRVIVIVLMIMGCTDLLLMLVSNEYFHWSIRWRLTNFDFEREFLHMILSLIGYLIVKVELIWAKDGRLKDVSLRIDKIVSWIWIILVWGTIISVLIQPPKYF